MKIDFRVIAVLIFLLLTRQSGLAATATGSSALALASVVAVHSPVLGTGDILLIRRLFNGHFHRLRGDTNVISVEANAIVCSIGNVDLTLHSCKLTFGGKTINLTGDAAYELYAVMSQAGVPSEGSAGEVHEGLSHLVCTIKPLEIAKRNGGGADCTFDAAASPAPKSNQ
jgi:hypothetical protein